MNPSVRNTVAGQVRGVEIADGVWSWRGIPYAAAPVGRLRWRPPQAPVAWTGVRDASAFAAPAPQPTLEMAAGSPVTAGPQLPPAAEDCLYLNVAARPKPPAGRYWCGYTAAAIRSAPAPT